MLGRKILNWFEIRKDLLFLWDYNKNETVPEKTAACKKVWWLCEKGHSYLESPEKAMRHPYMGCRICKAVVKNIHPTNNLAYNFPELMKEWDFLKNEALDATKILPGSKIKPWWVCSKGHSFQQSVYLRTSKRKQGCPFCAKIKVCEETSLEGHFLAKEFHPTKNQPFTAKDFFRYTTKKIWWLCSKGHEFYMSIYSRTKRQGKCPICFARASKLEKYIFTEICSFFQQGVAQYKKEGCEIDIYLPLFNIGLEVDGYLWHKKHYERDLLKNKNFAKHGISVIRIREFPLPKLSEYDIIVKIDYNNFNPLPIIKQVFTKISEITGADVSQYLKRNSLLDEAAFFELNMNPNIEETHPHLIAWWHPTKNKPLELKYFAPNSNKKVWWVCPVGHEFFSKFLNRVKGCGCPLCDPRTKKQYERLNPF